MTNPCTHNWEQIGTKTVASELVQTFVCPRCKHTKVTHEREHLATVIVFRLRSDTTTTYVIAPEVESYGILESLNTGKQDYRFTVALYDSPKVMRIFDRDSRIQEWHTEAQ